MIAKVVCENTYHPREDERNTPSLKELSNVNAWPNWDFLAYILTSEGVIRTEADRIPLNANDPHLFVLCCTEILHV